MTTHNGVVTAATLLIVDDDKDIREGLAGSLSIPGVNLAIHTAANAATALQQARRHQPDLMIIDFNMPFGDGFALAQEIRNQPSLKDTKLLMLTAQDTAAKSWESFEHDIDAFMGKPFNLEDVEAHIISLLARTLEKRPHKG